MTSNEVSSLVNIAINAANQGVIKAREFINNPKVISSNKKDIKTLADIKVNNVIIDCLNPTNFQIISEESINEKEKRPRRLLHLPIDYSCSNRLTLNDKYQFQMIRRDMSNFNIGTSVTFCDFATSYSLLEFLLWVH